MDAQRINSRDMMWAQQIRNSDQAAFSNLFEAYYKPLCEFAYRHVKNSEVMEDIVQEVFVRIWDHRDRWHPQVAVRAYLYRSVFNQVINDYRKKRYEISIQEEWLHNMIDDGNTPLDNIHSHDIADTFSRVIAQLPDRRREILVLRLLQGLSYKEIGEVLDISVNTVDTQIRRALKLLRSRLKHFVIHQEAVHAE